MRNLIQKNQTQAKQHKQSDIFFSIFLGIIAVILLYLAFKILSMSPATNQVAISNMPQNNQIDIIQEDIIKKDQEKKTTITENELAEMTTEEINNLSYNELLLLEYTPEKKKLIEGLTNYSLGSSEPEITIVEFSDFACPHCKDQYSVMRQLAVKYKDNVKIVFRNRPAFEDSIDLAMSAQCAGEQNKFWELHDLLFENQTAIQSNKSIILELANRLNIDITKFSDCIKNNKYLTNIKKDFSDSETLGVTGTPTFFINGEKFEGSQSLASFEEIIKQLTAK